MSGNHHHNNDICEYPIKLVIVDVEITEQAQQKLCAIMCNCDNNGNDNNDQ